MGEYSVNAQGIHLKQPGNGAAVLRRDSEPVHPGIQREMDMDPAPC